MSKIKYYVEFRNIDEDSYIDEDLVGTYCETILDSEDVVASDKEVKKFKWQYIY